MTHLGRSETMKKLIYFFMSLIFVVASGGSNSANGAQDNLTNGASTGTDSIKMTAQSTISQMEGGNYKEGELLVKFKSGIVVASSLKVHKDWRLCNQGIYNCSWLYCSLQKFVRAGCSTATYTIRM
jgi:hypothetical protein